MSQPQMTPPDDGAVPTPTAPLTDAERAAATAQVAGTALPPVAAVPDPAPEAVPPTPPTPERPVLDPEPEIVEPEPSTEVAVPEVDGNVIALADRFDVTQAGEAWAHGTLEFKGDTLGIRLPTRQALAAFSLASSKYVSLPVKNDLTGLFIARHLSPESYGRVFSRLMDPDEDDYDVETVGELFNAIVTAAVDADKAANKGDDAK
ncbi:tail assembly chaperone [Mycobacterium phage Funsized]|nr:tail assembly chaperone [Mycobacterium phage Funsized]